MQAQNLTAMRESIETQLDSRLVAGRPYGTYRMKTGGAVELFATVDAAITRTVMGEDLQQTLSAVQRAEWIAHINSFAHPDGIYHDLPESVGEWHSAEHRNGMTIGALGALGGRQAYPVSLYNQFNTAEKIGPWLEQVNWREFWKGSHVFWGGMHCFSLSSLCTSAWKQAAFGWLDAHLDPATGWWRKGVEHAGDAEHRGYQALGGGCHIWPIYQHLNHAFPYPTQVIDGILAMQKPAGLWHVFGSYMELDALYGLAYMGSLAPEHRRADIQAAVERHGAAVAGRWPEFLAGNPNQHNILALAGQLGLLQQLAPDRWRDKSRRWSDIFSDRRLYRTAQVEVV